MVGCTAMGGPYAIRSRGIITSVQPVFDGHNDALLRAEARALAEGRPDGHFDVPRARAGGFAAGMFAVFTPSPEEPQIVLRPGGGWDEVEPAPLDPVDASVRALRTAKRLADLEALGAVRRVRTVADLDACAADGTVGAVLHLEGAEAIDPDLEALETWHAAGLRSLGPVWSRRNVFGHGVNGRFPSSPDTGPGLSEAGERLVRRCNALGILVDASHLNLAGFEDLARVSEAPLVATHSCAHALAPASRNLTDDQLDRIAATGGLVGVAFVCPFLRADGADDPDTPLETVVAHVRHVAERADVDHVALGSDFDGATIPEAIGDVAGLPRLLDALRDDGFTAAEVEQIAWGNWRRVLAATWA